MDFIIDRKRGRKTEIGSDIVKTYKEFQKCLYGQDLDPELISLE